MRTTRRSPRPLALLFLLVLVAHPAAAHDDPPEAPGDPGAAVADQPCVGGFAGAFPCHHVDLVAFLPRDEMGVGAGDLVNDSWGWTDPATGIEYALVGTTSGTAFVSLENPTAPRWLGTLPTRSGSAVWRDLKVYANHVFVVADVAGHGMQVFDLTRLRGVASPQTFTPDAVYAGPGLGGVGGFFLGSSHNVAIDEATGFAYAVGSNTCAGGLHMVDVRDPRRPRFAGCFDGSAYVHDTQCVVYDGPDGRFVGREVCFNSAASSFSITDVTDKRNPQALADLAYPGIGYAHQGWLTEDQRYFVLGDELDELQNGHPTRTYVWDVSDLTAPRFAGFHQHGSPTTDHNLYVEGNHVYEANYFDGLRILEIVDPANAVLREVAFFDTVPARQEVGFGGGAWNVYPFHPSGLVTVTSVAEGLFVLRPTLGGSGQEGALPAPPAADDPAPEDPAPAPTLIVVGAGRGGD